MRCIVVVVVVVLVAACRLGFEPVSQRDAATVEDVTDAPQGPAFVPYWRSGSRLRAVVLEPEGGGDPIFWGFRDTQLGSDCSLRYAADSTYRCMPDQAWVETYYADAGCTQRLALVPGGPCHATAHAASADSDLRLSAHALGPTHSGTVYDDRFGCLPGSTPAGWTLRSIGAQVAVTAFVAGHFTDELVGDFSRVFASFADGARHDLHRVRTPDGDCFPEAAALGPTPCRATEHRATPVYADAACTARAYLWRRASWDPTSVDQLVVYDAPVCEPKYQLVRTGPEVAGTSYWEQTATGCQLRTATANDVIYTGTPIIDPYPQGTVVIGPRRGRIGSLYWIGPDGEAVWLRPWDHDLGVPCMPFRADDGVLRCLPERQPPAQLHAGAGCAAVEATLTPACFTGAPVYGVTYMSCSDDSHTVRALNKVTDTSSAFVDGSCRELAVAAYQAGNGGAILPTSMFPALVAVVE